MEVANPLSDSPVNNNPDAAKQKKNAPPEFVVEGKALGFLGADNPARQAIFKIMFNPVTDFFVMVLVTVSFVVLFMQLPSKVDSLSQGEHDNIAIVDMVILVVFTLECTLKVFALGFVNGDTTYLQSKWNLLDFFVVVCSWVDIVAQTEMTFFRRISSA